MKKRNKNFNQASTKQDKLLFNSEVTPSNQTDLSEDKPAEAYKDVGRATVNIEAKAKGAQVRNYSGYFAAKEAK